MILSKFVKIQLIIFAVLTVIALITMGVVYMRLPALVGIGRYSVAVELPTSGGLYSSANVTYRGSTIGTVTDVTPTGGGARATLNLDSSVSIPVSAEAQVHSRSAIGEQYLDFVPSSLEGPFLEDGALVPMSQTSVPQDIGPMIDTLNASLTSIPQQQLSALIDETHTAFEDSGPALQRILNGSDRVLDQAYTDADATTTLINDAAPFLDSQTVSSPAIREWVANLAGAVQQVEANDQHVRHILETSPAAAREASALFQQLHPTAPLLAANLTSLGQVAVTYNQSLEQLLVLLPASVSALKTINVPDQGTSNGAFLDFNLNLNAPPPCTTGFLPASERRDGSAVDAPTRTSDPIFCAVPQDSSVAVRGARNLPCMDNPGKRAPTVEICKSDEPYTSSGTNPSVGDPTPTTGNSAAPASHTPESAAPQIGTASYNPRSGQYQGSDGRTYTQTDLSRTGSAHGEASPVQAILTGGH